MTLNSYHANELAELAEKSNLNIFPVMQNRFSPPALWLKELIEAEILGRVFMVQVSCFWNRDDRYYVKDTWRGTKIMDGGTLFTQFSHYLDILYWLFGEITNIKSKLEDFNHQTLTEFEDSGIVTFDFKSGGIGSFNFSTSVWHENLESSITIIAENGSVRVGGQYMDHVEKCLIKDYKMPDLLDTNECFNYGNYKGSAQNHHFLYQNVGKVIKFSSPLKTVQVDESIKLIQMIEDIYNN